TVDTAVRARIGHSHTQTNEVLAAIARAVRLQELPEKELLKGLLRNLHLRLKERQNLIFALVLQFLVLREDDRRDRVARLELSRRDRDVLVVGNGVVERVGLDLREFVVDQRLDDSVAAVVDLL